MCINRIPLKEESCLKSLFGLEIDRLINVRHIILDENDDDHNSEADDDDDDE